MLARVLAQEWAADGIRVNAVAPGMIRTPLTERIYQHDEVKARREALVPLGRIGTPEDIAAIVAFLAGPGAGYVTGQVILADGGIADSALGAIPGLPAGMSGAPAICDVLVVGSGAGGLATAVVAAHARARRARRREGAGARRDDRLVRRLALDPAQPARDARRHRRGRGRAAPLSRERARQRGRRPAARRVPAQRPGDGALLRGGDRGRLRRRQPRARLPRHARARHRRPVGRRRALRRAGARRLDRRSSAAARPRLGRRHGHRLGRGPQPFRQRHALARVGAPCGAGGSCATGGISPCTGAGCSSSTATRWSARLLRSALDRGVAHPHGGARGGAARRGRPRRRGAARRNGAGDGAGAARRRARHRRLSARPRRASRRCSRSSGRPRAPFGGAVGEHRRRAADGRGGRRHGRRRPRASRAPGRRCRWCRGRTAASGASRTWSSAPSPASSPSTRAAGASSTRPTATTTSWRRCSAPRRRARSRSPG